MLSLYMNDFGMMRIRFPGRRDPRQHQLNSDDAVNDSRYFNCPPAPNVYLGCRREQAVQALMLSHQDLKSVGTIWMQSYFSQQTVKSSTFTSDTFEEQLGAYGMFDSPP